MDLNDWILALHLLSAFALVGAMVLFWILVVALRRTDLRREVTAGINDVAKIGTVVIGSARSERSSSASGSRSRSTRTRSGTAG